MTSAPVLAVAFVLAIGAAYLRSPRDDRPRVESARLITLLDWQHHAR